MHPLLITRTHGENEWLCWAQARCSSTVTAPLSHVETEIRVRYVGDEDGADDEWLSSSSVRLRRPRGWGGIAT